MNVAAIVLRLARGGPHKCFSRSSCSCVVGILFLRKARSASGSRSAVLGKPSDSPGARPSEKAPSRQIGRPTPNVSKAGKATALYQVQLIGRSKCALVRHQFCKVATSVRRSRKNRTFRPMHHRETSSGSANGTDG